jgi:hypothetical protein
MDRMDKPAIVVILAGILVAGFIGIEFIAYNFDEGGTDLSGNPPIKNSTDFLSPSMVGLAIPNGTVFVVLRPVGTTFYVTGQDACTRARLNCQKIQYKPFYNFFWRDSGHFGCGDVELAPNLNYRAVCT